MIASIGLSAQLITDFASLRQLSSEWTKLWNRCPAATPFQRPEWVLSWTEAFKPGELHVITIRRDSTLVGLAPLFIYSSGAEKVVAPLAASISDYVDWLIDPADSVQILTEMSGVLGNSEHAWDRVDLTDLPRTSSLLTFGFDNWECERSVENACPVMYLPAAKSVEELLPSKARHNLRTARHRIEKAGQWRVEVADQTTLEEFLAAMLRLHGARWKQYGSSGMLAEHSVQEFHRMATQALLKREVLRLYGLRFNGQLIATLYALAERDTVYCYLQGFDPAYAAFSPGAQILAAVIDDALREGKNRVDFLRGREQYKYAWGARDQETFRICLRRRARVQPPAHPGIAA